MTSISVSVENLNTLGNDHPSQNIAIFTARNQGVIRLLGEITRDGIAPAFQVSRVAQVLLICSK